MESVKIHVSVGPGGDGIQFTLTRSTRMGENKGRWSRDSTMTPADACFVAVSRRSLFHCFVPFARLRDRDWDASIVRFYGLITEL